MFWAAALPPPRRGGARARAPGRSADRRHAQARRRGGPRRAVRDRRARARAASSPICRGSGISPLRGMCAALFDPPRDPRALERLDRVRVVSNIHGTQARGLLALGWLASRLGWSDVARVADERRRAPLAGDAAQGRQPVTLELATEPGGATTAWPRSSCTPAATSGRSRATRSIDVRGPDLPPRSQPARSHSDAELLGVGARLARARRRLPRRARRAPRRLVRVMNPTRTERGDVWVYDDAGGGGARRRRARSSPSSPACSPIARWRAWRWPAARRRRRCTALLGVAGLSRARRVAARRDLLRRRALRAARSPRLELSHGARGAARSRAARRRSRAPHRAASGRPRRRRRSTSSSCAPLGDRRARPGAPRHGARRAHRVAVSRHAGADRDARAGGAGATCDKLDELARDADGAGAVGGGARDDHRASARRRPTRWPRRCCGPPGAVPIQLVRATDQRWLVDRAAAQKWRDTDLNLLCSAVGGRQTWRAG